MHFLGWKCVCVLAICSSLWNTFIRNECTLCFGSHWTDLLFIYRAVAGKDKSYDLAYKVSLLTQTAQSRNTAPLSKASESTWASYETSWGLLVSYYRVGIVDCSNENANKWLQDLPSLFVMNMFQHIDLRVLLHILLEWKRFWCQPIYVLHSVMTLPLQTMFF